ncbi:MAG: UDP-3-O-acyl-N-acetylglucosamine deacetylase [Cyanobacteria bacterium P01_A01_bin.45]
MRQHTLAAPIVKSGVGLHSGIETTIKILPAEIGSDRYFVRTDLPDSSPIPAKLEMVTQTTLSTQLGDEKSGVRTVEHLLASLAAMGVDNARIEIDGVEVPLLDGSAKIWTDSILTVGLSPQTFGDESLGVTQSDGSRSNISNSQDLNSTSSGISSGISSEISSKNLIEAFIIEEPIWILYEDAFVCAMPSAELRFSYGIDFQETAIGNQWYSWSPGKDLQTCQNNFLAEIAPARTFGLLHQIEHLRQAGLIKGGSLENALVCSPQGWMNPPLRFPNEPVRHKILDLVGDLSLIGTFPRAHFLAYKASHNLHIQLAKQIKKVVGIN